MFEGVEFLATDSVRTISWLVGILVLGLSVTAIVRAHFRPGIVLLELLRLAMVGLVLFALHQPERVVLEESNSSPKVAVLWDESKSMDTRDVLAEGALSREPISRSDWLSSHFDLAALREQLGNRFELVAGPFDRADSEPVADDENTEVDPEDVKSRTDMASPMDAILEDPEVRALVVIGDGDWNSGDNPAEVAMRFRMKGVPIFSTTVGSRVALPDLEVLPLEPPAFAVVGKPLAVPYAIRSALDRDVRVPVTLTDSNGARVTQNVLVRARSVFEDTLTITPNATGPLGLVVEVPVQSGELDESNNKGEAEIDIREESLRVLLIESFPRWEYRFMRNAMVRDPGVEVECYLFHPDLEGVGGGEFYLDAFPTQAELSQYDVIFLGDVGMDPDQLSAEECKAIRGVVAEQAAGLILMPGWAGNQNSLNESELGGLIPVELDPAAPYGHGSRVPANMRLTESGRQSALTLLTSDEAANRKLWGDLPGFQWHASVLRAKPGSTVLAVHDSRDDGFGRVPLLVTKSFGTGKVLFMGTDGAWRWREGLEDKIHYRFWRQVVRWMAYQRKMNPGDTMRLFYSPDRPGVGSTTTLFANVMDSTGAPLSGAELSARIEAPSGNVSRVTFTNEEGEWGLCRASYKALEPGDHTIVLTCKNTGDQLSTSLSVAGYAVERVGMPARPEVMAELSRISRGETVAVTEFGGVADRILSLETPPEVARRMAVRRHRGHSPVRSIQLCCAVPTE